MVKILSVYKGHIWAVCNTEKKNMEKIMIRKHLIEEFDAITDTELFKAR